MQQGTHKGSVLDVPSGTELFPVLESTQKFTADGVAHSSIPALRSNDEATGCSLLLLLLPFSLPISRVPPFFSCRLVASSRRESNHHPLSSPIPRYSNTKRSEKESRHFLASPERKSFYLVSVDIYIYIHVHFSTDRAEIGGCFRSTKVLLTLTVTFARLNGTPIKWAMPAFKGSSSLFRCSFVVPLLWVLLFFFPPFFFRYLNIDTTFMLILLVLHVLTNNTANASEISIVNKACYSKLAFYRACFIISCYLAFCNGIIRG